VSASLQDRVVHLDNAKHHGGLRTYAVSLIVMHTTEGGSGRSTIEYLNTTTDKTASYHYIIERDGTILRMLRPNMVAYHAGDSAWPSPIKATPTNQKPNGGRSVNRVSVGISWANQGEPLTDAQLESALWLCGVLCKDYGVLVDSVRGHYEVAPGRKTDPKRVQDMTEFRALLTNSLREAA
jgi:N-acetyl-anhydromuramyl-L-alanine amidase AmpD